jgi:hypothetical protein
MARPNGGIIGPDNVPTPFTAKGVWKISDAFNYQKAGLWPQVLGYQVNNSLRFNPDSLDYLNRTPASATNRQTFTLSTWVKRSKLGAYQQLFGTDPSNIDVIGFDNNDAFRIYIYNNPISTIRVSSQLFRDTSAWYHIVIAFDTPNATAQNRCRIYVNGTEITSWSTNNTVSQNLNTNFNTTTIQYIGRYATAEYIGGYMSEVYMIDGQQLTPSSFGQTDSTTGIWTPIAYTGTYGTNGYYLKFANSASLGTDSSGNGNNFTVNNLTSVDQSTDTPTNNFATLNPLLYSTSITYSEGNLKFTNTSAGGQRMVASSIAPTTGKWYAECRVTSLGGNYPQIGVLDTSIYTMDTYVGALARGYGYASHGQVYNNAGALTTGLATYTTNDIIGVALDLDNNYVYFSKNGTFINSGVPTSGSSGTGGWAITNGYDYSFGSSSLDSGTDPVFDWNFGSPFYSANNYTDAGGFGNFSYQPPSGYYALCTRTLAIYG